MSDTTRNGPTLRPNLLQIRPEAFHKEMVDRFDAVETTEDEELQSMLGIVREESSHKTLQNEAYEQEI